jgi:sarcosine/dimethylglycine N-methyltransferase
MNASPPSAPAPDALAQVVEYYETHPINEDQIRAAVAASGVPWDHVTAEILQRHDQDHFGGLDANDRLIAAAGIRPTDHVLDVCSGLGGPARYLARRIGCRVTGLDLTASRHESARRLTGHVGLGDRVAFHLGSALDMPFPDASFDVVMGQEAWCHVPDKARLIAECARVVKPGGVIAFTDILRRDGLSDADQARLAVEMTFPTLESLDGYRDLLEANACVVEQRDDLSALWTTILVDRLAMYRSLADHTERKFGTGRKAGWDHAYSFFVGLYQVGRLGGGRFVARRRTGPA